MEREERYLVIKRTDIKKYLPCMEHNQIIDLAEKVRLRRLADGRRDDRFVCVADDWPMYETVWKMIETWVDRNDSHSVYDEKSIWIEYLEKELDGYSRAAQRLSIERAELRRTLERIASSRCEPDDQVGALRMRNLAREVLQEIAT